MSTYFRFSLDFKIRRDTPMALQSALSTLAERRLPHESDLASLPPLVADYLRNPEGWEGDGFTYRYWHSGIVFGEERPEDATHCIHVERTFDNDEFWNGGIYFVCWLFQFAAEDGHLATMLWEFGAPPDIYTRYGDDILVTTLRYHPEEPGPLSRRQTPLDADNPIMVSGTSRQNLKDFLEKIASLAEIA